MAGMVKKRKFRREYDQKLITLMEKTQADWLHLSHLEDLCYEKNEELRRLTLVEKSKYFFLFQEAKQRRISIK